MSPRLLNAKDAARLLGLPYTSLRAVALRGELPVIRQGRAWYFRAADLEAWLTRKAERIA